MVPNFGPAAERLGTLIEALQKVQAVQMKASEQLAKAPPPAPLNQMKGAPVAFRSKGQRLLIEVSDRTERGFIAFVEDQLERLYDEWKRKT